jgi:FkbM family methyltransferase
VQHFRHRFQHLKHPLKNVLDVGAYRGEFARLIKEIFPDAKVKCIEGDERQAPVLQDLDVDFYLLSKKTKQLDFYTLPEDACTTGSSIYRENTTYYQAPLVVKKQAYALDDLGFSPFDLIKLDVQGSELDVLKGGKKYLARTQPRYLLIETSIQQYNHGAPLAGEVISYLNKIGYRLQDIFDVVYDQSNQLLQVDFLFEYDTNATKGRNRTLG